MKNFLTLFLFFLFFTQTIIAEDFSEFVGKISTKKGQVLSYKIVYKIMENNTIEGYSLTDIEGEKLTKSRILGQYNPSKKTLSFKETGNAFTKTGDDESTFCFIVADNLNIKKINGKTLIIGGFKGVYPSGKVGAEGYIILIESSTKKEIKLVANSTKPKIQNTTNSAAKKEIKTLNVADGDTAAIKQAIKSLSENQKLVLMSNEKLLIECSKTDLYLDVWDGGYVDGDSISIYLNNKILQKNILLTKARKTFKLTAPAESFNLKIVALNTGTRGANTASCEVKDQNNVRQFSSNLNKGESFDIEFHIK